MYKRFLVTLAVFGLVVAACGGGTASCEDVADETIDLVQGVIDEVDQMSPEDLAAMGEEQPEFMNDFEQQSEELRQDAEDAGCTDEQLAELFSERASSLTAESEFGQLFVELFNSGDLFEL